MSAMNKLVNLPEISETMAAMAREMEKAGLVDSIVGDALDSMDGDAVDAAADREVDMIVSELTAGILAPAAHAPEGKIKRPAAVAATAEVEEPAAAEVNGEIFQMIRC